MCFSGEVATCKDNLWMLYISRLDDEPENQHELI